jgi:hypothetical protein
VIGLNKYGHRTIDAGTIAVFLLPMDPVAAEHIPDDCFQRDGLPIR